MNVSVFDAALSEQQREQRLTTLSSPVLEEALLNMQVDLPQAAACVLSRIWQDLELEGTPTLFLGPQHSALHRHHIPALLEKSLLQGLRRSHIQPGQITHWEQLPTPSYAHGIAQISLSGPLLSANLLSEASVNDKKPVFGPCTGWFRYNFCSGWSALSVLIHVGDDDDVPATVTALPSGRQAEWLAFLKLLENLHKSELKTRRKGRVEVLGDGEVEVEKVIKRMTFHEVILPQEVLDQVASQRRIFSPHILERYERRNIARLRKTLLIGPPGTGKTSLLKAEAAHHIRERGFVFYLFASEKQGRSWRNLLYALRTAATMKLPTLIVVEDIEMFLADADNPQRVLNILDGVETPDNPAGTLLLMTSNDPDKIDPRLKDRPGRIDSIIRVGPIESQALALRFLQHFLGTDYHEEQHAPFAKTVLHQTGSHIREVCFAATIHVLEQDRDDIRVEDLLWAHEGILSGRRAAADTNTCAPPASKEKGTFFGKN